MRPNPFHLAVIALVLLSLACGRTSTTDQVGPTLEAGLKTAAPAIQDGLGTALPTLQAGAATALPIMQTALPTLQAGAATALPALQTVLPPELIPGQGLPLPGTLLPQLLDQLNQEQAALALEAYARDVLGINVDISIGRSTTVNDLNLPVTTESGANQAMQLAGVSYNGLFQDGIASLSLGSGTTSGSDLTGSLENASLGAFSINLSQTMPASADEALALIKATYPGIANRELILSDQTSGYTFQTSEEQDWAIANGQIILKGTLIGAGVAEGRRPGRITVWVTVASGTLAAPFVK